MLPLSEEIKKAPILFISLPFIAGIFLSEYFSKSAFWVYFSTGILISLSIFCCFYINKIKSSAFLLFIIPISLLSGQLHTYFKNSDSKPDINFFEANAYHVNLEEIPTTSKNKLHVTLNISAYRMHSKWVACNFLCYATIGDSLRNNYFPGQQFLLTSRMLTPQKPSIPGQFDFQKYLMHKRIFLISYIKPNEISLINKEKSSLILKINTLRQNILNYYEKGSIPTREKAVLSSFILGYKGEIDPELKLAFTKAGLSHILSVSGMHVGILYTFLLLILSFLDKNRKTKILKALIILITIWFYTLLSGYSPPVIRAAYMFSFIALAEIVNRNINKINILAFSALLLLIIDPNYIFDVGFQLSYMAMLGIFLFYIPLMDKWKPQNKYCNYVYSSILLSFSAQLAVLPLILFYFQQFPTYFLLFNLIILPLAGLILYGGIIYTAFVAIPYVNSALIWVLKPMLGLFNTLVLKVEDLPGNTISGFQFGIFELILLSATVLLFFLFIIRKNYFSLTFLLSLLLIISIKKDYNILPQNNETQIIKLNTKNFLVQYGNDFLVLHHELKIKTEHFENLIIKKTSENKYIVSTPDKFLVFQKNNPNHQLAIFDKNYKLVKIE